MLYIHVAALRHLDANKGQAKQTQPCGDSLPLTVQRNQRYVCNCLYLFNHKFAQNRDVRKISKYEIIREL